VRHCSSDPSASARYWTRRARRHRRVSRPQPRPLHPSVPLPRPGAGPRDQPHAPRGGRRADALNRLEGRSRELAQQRQVGRQPRGLPRQHWSKPGARAVQLGPDLEHRLATAPLLPMSSTRPELTTAARSLRSLASASAQLTPPVRSNDRRSSPRTPSAPWRGGRHGHPIAFHPRLPSPVGPGSKLAPAQPGHAAPLVAQVRQPSARAARRTAQISPARETAFSVEAARPSKPHGLRRAPARGGPRRWVGTKLAEGADRSTGKVFEAAQERAHYQCHPPGRAGVPGGVGVVRGRSPVTTEILDALA